MFTLLCLFAILTNSVSTLSVQKVFCPPDPHVTWNYLQTITLRLAYASSDVRLCVICQDYYGDQKKVDESSEVCIDIRFKVHQLQKLIEITPNFKTLSYVYTFKCTKQTLKSFLTVNEISSGEVCESYISKGNVETVILYESPNETLISKNESDVTFLFEKDWSVLWMNVAICAMAFNLVQISFTIIVVASFYSHYGNLNELRKTGSYAFGKSQSFISRMKFRVTKLCLTVDNYETYIAHDLAVRNIASTEMNNSQVNSRTRPENVSIIDAGIQVVNYSQPKNISLYD